MKTDREMTEAILAEVQKRNKTKKRRLSIAAAVLVLALAVSAVVTAQQLHLFPPRAQGNDTTIAATASGQPETSELTAPAIGNAASSAANSTADTTVAPYGTETTTQRGTAPSTTANLTTAQRPATTGDPTTTQGASAPDKSGGDEYGGPIGGVRIPVLPFDRSIQYTGEAITDAEAAAYFKENTWLQSALGASGVDASGTRFAEHGYCHVSYDGTEGKSFEVRQNFRDYLVWNGKGDLIAIVTLTKENGQLSATPAFGAPWFESYQRFLKLYAGQPLVFVYAGWMELVITPDEGVYNPQGTDVSRYLEGIENPYEIFRCDAATYVP
ncbi:MAG: hypothetical protein IKR49_02300 [Clostridia bacterium]|nr:hypothetical protein [Clostridia bacterium]